MKAGNFVLVKHSTYFGRGVIESIDGNHTALVWTEDEDGHIGTTMHEVPLNTLTVLNPRLTLVQLDGKVIDI